MIVGTVEATFLVLLVVIIFGPVLAERVNVPGIIGLIFGGMLFGPFVIDWLEVDGLVTDLGAVGILYLMFLAGASFDIRAFNEGRNTAIAYGLLGFIVPFLLTVAVVLIFFDSGILAAALIGAMWASNTLVAYPEVQAAGLQNNRAVSAAVSAGVVADLLSLTVLAVATATAVIEIESVPEPFEGAFGDLARNAVIEPSTPDPTFPIWVALPLLGGFCLWLLPRITEAFFVRVGHSRMQRFVFALAGMAAGATVAILGGVEGLIGAFLAGLGMNRLVPSRGPLMERLEFVGAAIFVPTFLVSIGLNIDPAVLVDPETLLLGLMFTMFVLVGKSVAALITGLIFKLSFSEIGVMSSLSLGQAASTLAIAQVGLSLGMFEQIVVNASVIAIVATALLTSYGTRYFARRVPMPHLDQAPIGNNILLDIRSNGSDLDTLIALTAAIANPDDGLVVPYEIADPGQLGVARMVVNHAVEVITAKGLDSDGVVRVDDSFSDGTLHLVEENEVSLVMLSWAGPHFAADYLLGNDIDGVGERCPVPTMAARVLRQWNRVVVVLGDTSTDWRLEDAQLAVAAGTRLRKSATAPLLVIAQDRKVAEELTHGHDDVEIIVEDSYEQSTVDRLLPDDMLILPAHLLHDLPPRASWRLAKSLEAVNIGVVAGPHRLSVSKGLTRKPLANALWQPTGTPE